MCSRKVPHESQFESKRCFLKKITAVSKLTVFFLHLWNTWILLSCVLREEHFKAS